MATCSSTHNKLGLAPALIIITQSLLNILPKKKKNLTHSHLHTAQVAAVEHVGAKQRAAIVQFPPADTEHPKRPSSPIGNRTCRLCFSSPLPLRCRTVGWRGRKWVLPFEFFFFELLTAHAQFDKSFSLSLGAKWQASNCTTSLRGHHVTVPKRACYHPLL